MVIDYLVNECGFKREVAERLCDVYSKLIERGKQLGSFPYYIAGEIIKAEYGDNDIPESDIDPNWIEPSLCYCSACDNEFTIRDKDKPATTKCPECNEECETDYELEN